MMRVSRKWSWTPWTRVELLTDPETGRVLMDYSDDEAGNPRYRYVTGAAITDRNHEESHGLAVVYRVTIGRGNGRRWIRTIEVETYDGRPVDPQMMRRIPLQALADYASLALAEAKAAEDEGEILAYIGEGGLTPRTSAKAVPTSAEVAGMLRHGMSRHEIAAKYDRSASTVSDWIGKAYRDLPGEMPARRPGGRRPTQTTGGDRSPVRGRESAHEEGNGK